MLLNPRNGTGLFLYPLKISKKGVKKVFFEVSQNSQENICVGASFLIKYQALACSFIEKETLAQVFPCNFEKFLRTPFPTEHLQWLLLNFSVNVDRCRLESNAL